MAKRTHKHTPGSWGCEDPMGPDILSIVANPGAPAYAWVHVAMISTEREDGDRRSMAEHKANARLIAAAPNLLAAAEFARSAIDKHLGDSDPSNGSDNPLFLACQKLSAALESAVATPARIGDQGGSNG